MDKINLPNDVNFRVSFGQRLQSLRGTKSREEFAEGLGIHPQTLRKYEKGERVPDAYFIRCLSEWLGISADWLIQGDSVPIGRQGEIDQALSKIMMIPLVKARLSAGGGSLEAEDTVVGHYGFLREWLGRRGNPAKMVLMTVAGDSMEPEIRDGDMVLVDQSQCEVVIGKIYAVGIEDAVAIKSVDMLPGQLLLRSLNPVYQPVSVDLRGDLADGVRIIGRVIWWCREAR